MKLNVIVLIFLLEIVCYSTADEWKDLRKKLIALSILSGLQPIRKQYVVPLPFPLPLPFLISKISPPVVLPPEKKFPIILPKHSVPIFQMIPKFLPIEQQKKKQFSPPDYEAQESQLYPQFQAPNYDWDHTGWAHDSLYASTDNIPFSDMQSFHTNEQHETRCCETLKTLNREKKYDPNNFGDAHDDYERCQLLSKKEADVKEKKKNEKTVKPETKPQEKRNYRSNRSMSKLYDNYDQRLLDTAQSVHYDDITDYNGFGYPFNGDLLMSSSDSVNIRNRFNERQTNRRIGTKRSATNFDTKEKASTNGNSHIVKRTPLAANKFKDGLPVSADEIKVILNDLKTLNDEIKVIPSGHVFARDPPLVNTGVKRIQVGEIRIRPKQLSSLISSGHMVIDNKHQ